MSSHSSDESNQPSIIYSELTNTTPRDYVPPAAISQAAMDVDISALIEQKLQEKLTPMWIKIHDADRDRLQLKENYKTLEIENRRLREKIEKLENTIENREASMVQMQKEMNEITCSLEKLQPEIDARIRMLQTKIAVLEMKQTKETLEKEYLWRTRHDPRSFEIRTIPAVQNHSYSHTLRDSYETLQISSTDQGCRFRVLSNYPRLISG